MAERIKAMIDDFMGKLPKQPYAVAANVKADLLLVNCIDCRYPHAIHKFMQTEYAGKVYDQLVLAGAALASTEIHTSHPNWASTFREHVGLAINLHAIDGVLVLDHRTCGAYIQMGLLTEADHNTQREFDQHEMVAKDSAEIVAEVFRLKPRKGYLCYELMPEIAVGESDFPTKPQRLHALTV